MNDELRHQAPERGPLSPRDPRAGSSRIPPAAGLSALRNRGVCFAAGLMLLLPTGPLTAQDAHPFQNPDLPIEDRVSNLISLLTREEKVALLGSRAGVPRLGLPVMGHSEGLHGLAQGGPSNWGQRNPHPTTIFPQAYGLGETWDPELMRQVGALEGYEARFLVQNETLRRASLIIRAPNADLGRDPRWGRTEECYGEDPFFNGTMAAAFIRGLQGDHPKYWLTAALLKHFLANSNEDGRSSSSSDFDEQLFREYYSVPFRMGFQDGGARCFMAAYNAWNRIPCTIHPMLKDVAVKEWAVDGIICTDGGALRQLVTDHRAFATTNEAAAACVQAGINQFLDNYRDSVETALATGLLSEAEIDQVIRGTLRVFLRLGLLDPPDRVPYGHIGRDGEPEPWLSDKHQALARLATQKSVVLLKNAKGLLPLDRTKLKSIAVVGPRADVVLLDWYSGTPPYAVTPLQGITNKVGPTVAVSCATTNAAEAVRLARAADVAIVCVGNNPIGVPDGEWGQVSVPSEGREAKDRQSLTLEDETLIRQVYAANRRTVVVLIASFPYAINWTQKHVPAIVHLTQGSQELGNALADVLFGDYNPAGRLVQTWPRSLDQLPPMMDYDIRHGRTYQYFKGRPLYPFGHGLSYTKFTYSGLRTSSSTLATNGCLTVSVDVRNSGGVAGEEVVQLYVKHRRSRVPRPLKELRGFQRVALEPGESRTVELPLAAESLAYWDGDRRGFVVEPDRIEISVGGSSADERLQTRITVR